MKFIYAAYRLNTSPQCWVSALWS